MGMKSDIEIAQEAQLLPIGQIADKLGVAQETLEPYGRYKAKLDIHALRGLPRKAKLVLVTAISPTPAGMNITGITATKRLPVSRTAESGSAPLSSSANRITMP